MPIWTPKQIRDEAVAKASRGLLAAAYFYQGLVRQTLSVPAPRARYKTNRVGKLGTVIHPYRAATAATPGAPPRKLSGELRRSMAVDYSRFNSNQGVIRVGPGKGYGARLELEMDHRYMLPTLTANLDALGTVAGYTMRMKPG